MDQRMRGDQRQPKPVLPPPQRAIGGTRIVDLLVGDPLPRIC
jgi:hypothetical protein